MISVSGKMQYKVGVLYGAMQYWKKSFFELLGTFFLVFFGTGSAVITLMISESVNPNNVGIGILGGLGDWIAIALAFGLTVMVCIYLFGRISGAHFKSQITN